MKDFFFQQRKVFIEAHNVIVATGAFQKPKLPPLASELSPEIFQLHTSQYKSPEALPAGAVLVVGSGQSGCQITEELYQSGRKVYLSVGSTGRAPRRYRGKDTVFWMKELGLFDRTVYQLPSPKARFASNPHVSGKGGGQTFNLHQFARDGVVLLGHLNRVQGNRIFLAPDLRESLAASDRFANDLTEDIDEYIEAHSIKAEEKPSDAELRDGYDVELLSDLNLKAAGIQTIIWATGYRTDFSWIKMSIFDEYGYPLHERGVTDVPGLYFLGLLWLHTSGSSLLTGVGDDATHIAQVITASED